MNDNTTPRKGDVWVTSGRFSSTAKFLDSGDGYAFSVLLDGPNYQSPCGSYLTVNDLEAQGFSPKDDQ